MSKKMEFSKEEKERIIKLFKDDGYSCRRITKEFNLKSSKPIIRVLDEFGLDHSRGNLSSYKYYYSDGIYNEQDEKNILNEILNIPEISNGHQKYYVNEHYFDDIRNPEVIYTLGFLYADGSNNPKSGITMCLEEQDGYILERININMNNENPVKFLDKSNKHDFGYNYKNQYMFKTYNSRIIKVLTVLGVVQNKSLILEFPKWLHPSMYPFFLLGVFDGDGSLYKYDRKDSTPQINLTITSTEQFCKAIVDICAKYLDIRGHIYDASCHNGITKVFTLSGSIVVKKFLDWMYKDATIFLQRKFDRYNEYYINKSNND